MLRYKCLYIYFNGGPLGVLGWQWLKYIEPFLYRIAKVKVVVMPYGSDVQDITRSPNLNLKHAISQDYPLHRYRREIIQWQIALWSKHANHVISGCDWVDYMYHWDTLMLSHFSIDVDRFSVYQTPVSQPSSKIKILHAPNHRKIKGTEYIIKAVDELVSEGFDVELILAERMSNEEIRTLLTSVDIVADQLIIGWYAMFAIEGMVMGKPVLCFIRSDLEELYIASNLIQPGELPLVKCNPLNVKQVIKDLIVNREKINVIGEHSRAFVIKHHSLEAVGGVFDKINRSLGVYPSAIMGQA